MPERAETVEHRWRAFAGEYIKHFNGQKAVEECGCYKAKDASARVRAAQLLNNAKVQVVIREAIEARNARTHVDQDRVLLEIARIAFSQSRAVGYWDDDELHLTPSANLSEDDAASVSEITVEIEEFKNKSGTSRKVIKRKFRLHDKVAALDKLARHVGLYEADNKRIHEFGVAEIPTDSSDESWETVVDKELKSRSNGKDQNHMATQ